MDYPWAVVGAKVVCINPKRGGYDVPGVKYNLKTDWPLKLGKIYTIKSVCNSDINTDGLSIMLEEIPLRTRIDKGYAISRFKPLEGKKLPDVLTSILINPKKKIEKDQFDLVKV